MKRKFIKSSVTILSALVITGVLVFLSVSEAFAGKKIRLNSKKLDIMESESHVLRLIGAGKNVKWSIKSGKDNVSLESAKANRVIIYGKKAGSASVKAKFKGKTYTCKVNVSALPYTSKEPDGPQVSPQQDGTDNTNTTQQPEESKKWRAVAGFGSELLQNTWEKGENIMVSPISVYNALAMAANGAKGETLAQIENAFGMSLSECNNYLASYNSSLPSGSKYKLSPANSIWIKEREDFIVEQDFIDKNMEVFNASVYPAAFNNETKNNINNWVNKNTDGMINKVIDEIPEDAQMYLINALAFDAEWRKPYNSSQVREGVFTEENGKKEDVQMMYSEEDIYIEDKDTTGFIKYYADNKYAFIALLPNEGIGMEDYIKNLDGQKLDSLIGNKRNAEVKTAIPKFESEFETKLNDALADMGIIDAFDTNKADFTGIGRFLDGDGLRIDDVIHKTFIKVDEKGTKAGAVTAVSMIKCTSLMPGEVKKVYLDRPFIYIIADCQTWLPAFIGIVQDM